MTKSILRYSLALAPALLLAVPAWAATSFSNSLTGFTGNSTEPATQTAVTAAGFSFFSIDPDPMVVFDSNGAQFGTSTPGDGGRNYVRTLEEDYATVNFTAEITFSGVDLMAQDVWFGLGSGDTALFGNPDWSSQVASVFVLPEISDAGVPSLTQFYTNNDIHNDFNIKTPTTMADGTHRVRMTFESAAQTVQFAIDLNYSGGPFAADTSGPVIDLSTPEATPPINLFSEDGWPAEPSRVYFGGDDGVAFKDFSVTVGAAGDPADFDADGDVDGADFLAWQRGFGTTTGAAKPQGDANGDGDVDGDDFKAWISGFPPATPAAAIPEPATLALLALAAGCLALTHRRKRD